MFIFKAVFLAILLQNSVFIQSYEYCKEEHKICLDQRRHIVCFKEQIQPVAEYHKHYIMTDSFRMWFLYWHNFHRNQVACGEVQGADGTLPPAMQMMELTWDYELEYLASVHAGRCKMQHDQCRNTKRIPDSGQNLAYHKTTGLPHSPFERAKVSVYNWFKESADTPKAIIDKYEKIGGDKKIGHFTVLANDKIGRVGCAMVFAKSFPGEEKKFVYNFVSCNYDYTNIISYPVYKKGESASNCKFYGVGKSSNFSCLCANRFKPNPLSWLSP